MSGIHGHAGLLTGLLALAPGYGTPQSHSYGPGIRKYAGTPQRVAIDEQPCKRPPRDTPQIHLQELHREKMAWKKASR